MDHGTGEPRRVALVTGASSGIGRAIALELASRGHDVVVTGRNADRLSALTEDVRRRGAEATPIPCDLARPGAAAELGDELVGRGGVDVLVNCAGRGAHGPLHRAAWAATAEVVAVNVTATTELTARLVPGMVDRRAGSVLNIASTAAFFARPDSAVYSATKAYVVAFTRSLALELRGTGVTATAFCPGPTASAFAERAGIPEHHAPRVRTPAQPDDVAVAALDAMFDGRSVVVHGRANTAAVLVTRILPASQLAAARRWAATGVPGGRR